MQNLSCRNVLNVKFPKIVAEQFAFYRITNLNHYLGQLGCESGLSCFMFIVQGRILPQSGLFGDVVERI